MNLGRRLGSLPLEIDRGQRRESKGKRIWLIHVGDRIGAEAAEIADVRTAVSGGVGVEYFGVKAGLRDTDEVAFANDGSGVHDDDEKIAGIFTAANEGQYAVVGVVRVQPFETLPVEIDLMERVLGGIVFVEVGDETLNASVGIMLEKMPIQAVSFAPFLTLGKFLPHEKKFFAGMGVLIREQETEVGKLLPEIAGHFVKERVFSMNDFVVGERKQEILAEGVKERESEIVVLVLAVNGIGGKIF